MNRWLADTLFKRLFALMWLALVISHAVAFFVVTHDLGTAGRPLPTFPSLPPFSSGNGERGPDRPPRFDGGHGGPGGPGGAGRAGDPGVPGGAHGPGGPGGHGGPGGPGDPGANPSIGLSPRMLALDYGIRFLIIGLAAWLGARWLSRPVRDLAAAARALGRSSNGRETPPQVDERNGTIEVRDAAQVFNSMSRRLSENVASRALLVAAISHDLRTPLTRIRMRLEANESDPSTMRSIADIHEMDDLIESALDVFRGSDHEEPRQVTDVLALVQSLTDDMTDLGQPVSMQGSPALASVQPMALRRVVSNLVNNAVRYGERAEVSVNTHAHGVEIVVDDFGPGIPASQLEAVMQPFFRLDPSRNRLTGGSGLGLYIARDLITRQGGELTLANRAEGGLRATIALQALTSASNT